MRRTLAPLSRDKLAEARFFLARLRRTKGKHPGSRFYSSAAISAARSVSLVLQSELRSGFGQVFDAWWLRAKDSLGERLQAFRIVRDARNAVQKHGNVVLRTAMEQHYDDGPVISITLLENPATVGSVEVVFDTKPEAERALTPLTDEYLEGLTQSEIEEIIYAKVALMKDLAAKLQLQARGKFTLRHEFVLGEPATPFLDFVAELSVYLSALEELLDNADRAMGAHLEASLNVSNRGHR